MTISAPTQRHQILLVDDDLAILDLYGDRLSAAGYPVSIATTGEDALEEVTKCPPSAMILDIRLPDMSGLEVCKAIKENATTSGVSIVMFTKHHKEGQQMVADEMGADAYMLKDCSQEALLYCIKGLLETRIALPKQKLSVGPITLYPKQREVTVKKKSIPTLTSQEFNLLGLLMQESPRVVSWQSLLEKVWGLSVPNMLYKAPPRIKICVEKLRRKLGPISDFCLITHRSEGLNLIP
ncbi:MAG: response regulator transcription factor [Elusimicrobia bacterium]|nr:response regulator transcription factor [Elusimicrobiota bacterium]